MDLSDRDTVKEVVEACARGDREYQKQLYKAMYSSMMAVCYRYASRREDAKDLFQEGFIKVFDKIGKYNFKGSLQGWIRRIMVNHAIDHYRRNKNKFSMSESLMEAERIPEKDLDESVFEDITADELLSLVQELSPVYRSVFNMYVLDDYTHAEIAEELGISEGTSKSNLSKAKRNLKTMVLQKIKNEKQTAK
ncbi:MAG: RNA polymerase subunit sigma-70 [Flavobacteriales bacterium]|nr:RNA polymerase subunit sigma-70 [Flavobacteriales bacterium]|tara:strand:- start:743 stop:1321 length:579 start_codon:yes stop_codon:yes gene_type:complete